MITGPTDRPVTTPDEDSTVAFPLELELQTPPKTVEVSSTLDPTHTLLAPLINPAIGAGATFISLLLIASLQPPNPATV